MRPKTVVAFAVAALAAASAGAHSQDYPSRPIRLVVPFPPGGLADVWARAFGQELNKAWGQPVVIDNRPGAGTTIAADIVARAPADGHTVYFTNVGHSMSASLYRKLPYDAVRDFGAITLVGDVTSILAATPSLQAASAKELIALARAKPGALSFASAGNGTASHLLGEYLKLLAGVDMVHVPYKGTAPALGDLLAGRVTIIIEPMPTMLAHVRAGRLKAIGVTTAKRAAAAPEIPPLAETGLPGFDASTWYGVLVPAGLPQAVSAKLHAGFIGALRTAEMRERFASQGAEPVGNTPAEFTEIIRRDIARWAKVIREAGVTVN